MKNPQANSWRGHRTTARLRRIGFQDLSGGDVGGSHTLPYMQDWVGEEVVILEILAVTITIVRL